jgi:peptidoglycan/xylan/chitin deacetylase (PgdA/CDA1 family)
MERRQGKTGAVSFKRAFAAVFGAGIGCVLFFQPRWVLRRISRSSRRIVWFRETDARLMALTIDDAPDAEGTPRILDVLAVHEARATFFLLAHNIPGNEQLVQRLLAEGHEIGNHMLRDEPSWHLDRDEFERQFLEADAALGAFVSRSQSAAASGCREISTRWFRPVSGFTNPPMLDVISRHGAICVLGSIYPYDPHIPSPRYAALQIRTNARPGEIIILHDGPRRGPRTADTLDRVLPDLTRRGFRLVTLTELWRA